MRRNGKTLRGFALPSILISSVVMMIVLVVAASSISTTRIALNDRYYNKIASDAAQSGVVHAQECVFNSNTTAEWSSDASSQLRPGTGCTGGSQCSTANCYVLFGDGVRSTYSVGSPTTSADGTITVTVRGVAQVLRHDGSVWKEYARDQRALVRFSTTPQIASGAGWKNSGHNGYMLSGEGILWGWGDNSSRQLGGAALGNIVKTPVRILLPAGMDHVKKFTGSGQGASFLCALMVSNNASNQDAVYCRGNGNLGMAATGGWVKFSLPATPAQYPVDMAVQGYGRDTACVLTNIGNVYCVGENPSGQQGLRTTESAFVPLTSTAKQFLMPGTIKAKEIFTQDRITCAIGTDNKAYCAGDNALGQLGRGNITTNVWIGNSNPERVQVPGNPNIKTIRLNYHGGSFASHFLTTAGDVYMTGAGWSGTANDGVLTNRYSTPRLISGVKFGNLISVGEDGSSDRGSLCAIALESYTLPSGNGMWCLGAAKYGQGGLGACGDGATRTGWINTVYPAGAGRIDPNMNSSADYQMNSVMVIDKNGAVYAAGDNTYGKLGTGAAYAPCNSLFKKVQMPSGVKAVAVANADEYTAYILGDDDNLYAMGRNNEGQLGNGTTTNSNVPVKVQIPRQFSLFY